jgi:hypothetical protein
LPITLRQGSSIALWKTMPTPPCGFVTGRPSTRICPALGGQAGDHFQERGLAAARRPDNDEKLALSNDEVDRPQ